MKKILIIAVAMVMVFSLVECGGSNTGYVAEHATGANERKTVTECNSCHETGICHTCEGEGTCGLCDGLGYKSYYYRTFSL